MIEKKIKEYLDKTTPQQSEYNVMAKAIADSVKNGLKQMGKDARYKFVVQCVVGINQG